MKIFWTILFVCASPLPVNAGPHSEFFYQPGANQSFLTSQYSYQFTSTQLKEVNRLKSFSSRFGLMIEHGWEQNVAIGAKLGYKVGRAQTPTQGTIHQKGLEDFHVFLKGSSQGRRLRYGTGMSASLDKKELKNGRPQNAFSGGAAWQAYLGYQRLWGSQVLGVRVSHNRPLTFQRVESDNTTTKQKGGAKTSMQVFSEVPYLRGLVGLSAHYAYITIVRRDSQKPRGGHNTLGGRLYTTYSYSPDTTVLAAVEWKQVSNGRLLVVPLQKKQQITLQLGSRISFY